ncbi:MAG: ThiF family adenylyltransferase [Merdibacter sp.]
MEQADTRTKLLIGEEGAAVLKARTVCVLGIGGVGSFCVEALARSGIGRLILVDGVVAPSNLNRQLMAVQETIGKAKTEARQSGSGSIEATSRSAV